MIRFDMWYKANENENKHRWISKLNEFNSMSRINRIKIDLKYVLSWLFSIKVIKNPIDYSVKINLHIMIETYDKIHFQWNNHHKTYSKSYFLENNNYFSVSCFYLKILKLVLSMKTEIKCFGVHPLHFTMMETIRLVLIK